ncbi:MAG: hypothetical protein ACJAUY_002205 [Cognaticolwellia sp.]|jgi:hypothetical protein|nr:hypothetical protein DBO93_10535 [Colwellia sp. Arc7-D]
MFIWIFHFMSLKKALVSSLISLCITSCAFQPALDSQPYCQRGETFTKKLTLKATDMDDIEICEDRNFGECLVEIGLIVPVSFIISGSVVLLGNTLYWTEHTLSC